MPAVTDRLVEVRCNWCGTMLARASAGAVVEAHCRKCKLLTVKEVK
jgi:phage FluMu protein Com